MIEYGTLLRLSDGLPLSASTDNSTDNKISVAKKAIKLLAQSLSKQPNRVCLQEDLYTIHCIHNSVVGFVCICDPIYSHLLAHAFLDELQKEFDTLYTSSVVATVRRPYAFIEFDGFIQKMSKNFSSPHSVASLVNLTELRAELSVRPPIFLSLSEFTQPTQTSAPYTSINIRNGSLPNGTVPDRSQVGVSAQLMPLTLFHRFTMLVAMLFMFLDTYRGISSLSQSSLEEYDGPSPVHGIGFLMECGVLACQVEMLRRYHRVRKMCTLCCAVFLCLQCAFLLATVRDASLSLAYGAVSVGIATQTVNRNFHKKLQRFNV